MKIVVNRHNVQKNKKTGEQTLPVFSVQDKGQVSYGHRIRVCDRDGEVVGDFVHDLEKPLSCGASVWFELYNGSIVHLDCNCNPIKPLNHLGEEKESERWK